MNLKLTGRLLAAALMSLTAAGCQGEEAQTPSGDALSTQEARAEQQCVEGFNGIKNCATGSATLARSAKGIAVSGLNDVKEDGFSSEFPKATSWALEGAISGISGLSLVARDGEQAVSSIQLTPTGKGDQVTVAPVFTGSPGGSAYRVNVYQAGRMIGSMQQGPHNTFDLDWYNIHIRLTPMFPRFRNHISMGPWDSIDTGACVWGFGGMAARTFSVNMGGKVVVGDQLEIVEVVADGAYPYTSFSAIDVKAAASDFTLLGESTVAEK